MLDKAIKHKTKKDKYYKARGGTAQFLDIFCSKCNAYVVLYQKDGPGNLFRLYIDRIFESDIMENLQGIKNKSNLPTLKCSKCGNIIGIPMVYEREKRLAFRLIRGTTIKRRHKA